MAAMVVGRFDIIYYCDDAFFSLLFVLFISLFRCSHMSQEYYDYVFPDEQAATGALKILEMAQKWKKMKAAQETAVQPLPAAAAAEREQENESEMQTK